MLVVRHGSLLGIGYILVGLRGKWDFENKARLIRRKIREGLCLNEKKALEDSEYRRKFEEFYSSIKFQNHIDLINNSNQTLTKEILGIVDIIDKKNMYRGKGAELMRTAVNHFIRLIAESETKLDHICFMYFYEVLVDNLKHPNADIQKDALDAFKNLFHYYDEIIQSQPIQMEIRNRIKDFLKLAVHDESVYTTKGFTSAIPYFHFTFLNDYFNDVLDALTINSKVKKSKNDDSETRKFAVESLCQLASSFILKKPDVILPKLQNFIDTIFDGLEDYEIDNKLGDVGSKIREASMRSLTKLFVTIFHLNDKSLTDVFLISNVYRYLSCLIKQNVEKMNKIRLCAGESLQEFFFELKDANFNGIPNFSELRDIYNFDIQFDDNNKVKNSEWQEPAYCFRKLWKILTFKDYSLTFFDGLIISMGGINEDVTKFSNEAFDEAMKSVKSDPSFIDMIYKHILTLLKKYSKNDRVIEPLFNTISILLSKPAFINSKFVDYVEEIHKSTGKENYESKNIHKILNSVDIYYNMLFFEKTEKIDMFLKAMRSMLFLMNHGFPVVRKKAAEKVYTFFLTIDDGSIYNLSGEDIETISNLLSETNWTQSIKEIKEPRNLIAEMLKISLK